MGQKRKSLRDQIKESYDSMLKIGGDKHADKLAGIAQNHIYSWETYRSYNKQSFKFADWVKQQEAPADLGHKARTLEEARRYVEPWLQHNIDRGLSPYTIKLQASALAKIYKCDFDIETPSRSRDAIKRSRGEKARDAHFNEELHKDLVSFCRCTGLRRSELEQIRGTDLITNRDGSYALNITRGTKGGRARVSPLVGPKEEIEKVIAQFKAAGNKKVYPHHKISPHADIHSYRADYATRVYNANKRDYSAFKNERVIIYKNRVIETYTALNRTKKDRESFSKYYSKIDKDQFGNFKMLPGYRDVASAYTCRNDLATVTYDRKALFAASQALGHNRECVVAEHYLRA